MGNAKRDDNNITTLLGVSSADGTTPVTVYVDPTSHRLLVDIASGITGPGSSTDNSVPTFDGTGGDTLQDQGTMTISDTGTVTVGVGLATDATLPALIITRSSGQNWSIHADNDDLTIRDATAGADYLTIFNASGNIQGAASLLFSGGTYGIGNAGAGIIGFDRGSAHPSGYKFSTTSVSAGAMYITDAGNVGIGETSPNAKLQVAGIGRFNSNSLNIALTNAADTSSMYLQTDTAGTEFSIANNGGTKRLVIDSSGNVGIGTTAPVEELHVHSSGSSTRFNITNSTTGATVSDGLSIQMEGNEAYIWNYESSNMRFGTSNDTKMLIDTSGNVGIGTTSPDRKLHSEVDDATTNAVTDVLRLTHTTSGTPANNIGVGMEFEVETGASNNEIGATIEAIATDTTSTSEDFDVVVSTMAAGATASERLRINSSETKVTGNLQVTGTAYFDAEVDNGNSGTTDTIDWTVGNKQKSTLTGNVTFTFSPEPSGPCNLILKLVQDGTGSRTVTWPADVKWPGGTAPTLTTAASAVDIISFYYDGTDFYGQSGLNFS